MSPGVKSGLKLSLIGIVAFVVFLVATLPANVAYSYWKKILGVNVPIVLGDVEGSIWSGKAGKALVKGQRLEAITWDVNVYTLLLGILELNVELKVQDGYAKGIVGHSFFGGSYFSNVEAWLPVSEVANLLSVSALRPAGDLDVQLSSVKIDNNTIVSAKGDLAWHSAEMTLLTKLSLGDLQVTLEPSEDGIKGVLADQGGPLIADGILQLNRDNSYQFNGAFAVRGNQPNLTNALRTMGRPGPEGKVKVSQSGNLSAFGLL
ncbi:MAG: type II secretion system protein N [Gammaproteobacteria bacterium]|nr:type II secretion system protein N [Gammaproteobacteria bacterium]